MSTADNLARDENTTSKHPELDSPGEPVHLPPIFLGAEVDPLTGYTNEGRRNAASDVPANDIGTEGSAPRSDPAASGKVIYAESSYGAGSSGGGDWLEEGLDS